MTRALAGGGRHYSGESLCNVRVNAQHVSVPSGRPLSPFELRTTRLRRGRVDLRDKDLAISFRENPQTAGRCLLGGVARISTILGRLVGITGSHGETGNDGVYEAPYEQRALLSNGAVAATFVYDNFDGTTVGAAERSAARS